jgi:single-strand DNA-binding protein
MNFTIISGQILSSQLRYTDSNKSICEMQLQWDSGTPEEPQLHKLKLVSWEKMADKLYPLFPEGSYAIAQGTLDIAVVQRTDGIKQKILSLTVQKMLLGYPGLALCSVSIAVRCGQDPEVRYYESGSVRSTVSVAVNKRSRKEDAKPNWFDVECWSGMAEVMGNYVHKGTQLGLHGTLKIESWQDRETGNDRWKPVLLARDLTLLTGAEQAESA